jgi:hypothetical protein
VIVDPARGPDVGVPLGPKMVGPLSHQMVDPGDRRRWTSACFALGGVVLPAEFPVVGSRAASRNWTASNLVVSARRPRQRGEDNSKDLHCPQSSRVPGPAVAGHDSE